MGSKQRKQKIRVALVALLIVATLGVLYFTASQLERFLTAGSPAESGSSSSSVIGSLTDQSITVNGVRYVPRSGLETFLVMGVDRTAGQMEASGLGGQADVLLLFVMDPANKSYKILQVNRDIMAYVTVVDDNGEAFGEVFTQICLAHSYGKGDAVSCENTVLAVSTLLSGVAIDHYAAVDVDCIADLNASVGGVTVTIPSDMTAVDEAFTKGAVLTLTDAQAEQFVRARMALGDTNNQARMVRQQQYLAAWKAAAREKMAKDPAFITQLYNSVKAKLVTDMSEKKITSLANDIYQYTGGEVLTLAGENQVNENDVNEFYVDKNSLRQLLVELFYEEDTQQAPQ